MIFHPGLLSALIFSFAVTTLDAGTARAGAPDQLCQFTAQDFQARVGQVQNRIAFDNPAGYLSTGLCWWHSRFQRNATYLMEFRPDLKRLPDDARNVLGEISAVMWSKTMVSVRGFSNLSEYSVLHEKEITEMLNQWQISDTVLRMSFFRGLQGKAPPDALMLKSGVDDAVQKVAQGQIVFQMLQVPGIIAHAWLVYRTEAISNSVMLDVVDSNFAISPKQYLYVPKMDHLTHPLGPFIPYTQREDELQADMAMVIRTCKERGERSPLEQQWNTIFQK